MKAEYDSLYVKDDQGTITDIELARMEELVGLYNEDQAKFDEFESERLAKVRENTEKEFNKEQLALDAITIEVANLVAAVAAQQTANTTADTDFAALGVEITTLEGILATLNA
jgi:uncharacterized protein YeaO (DUF488 family)